MHSVGLHVYTCSFHVHTVYTVYTVYKDRAILAQPYPQMILQADAKRRNDEASTVITP